LRSKNELDEYLKNLEEAEKRDHRKLGKEMGLFVFSELVGPGLPLYTAKGAAVRQEIVNYSNELQRKIGYETVYTPNMNRAELFKVSGTTTNTAKICFAWFPIIPRKNIF